MKRATLIVIASQLEIAMFSSVMLIGRITSSRNPIRSRRLMMHLEPFE